MIALIAGPGKPPRSVQGLGLPYLAAVLETAGFEAKIFDLYPAIPDSDDPVVLDQRLADAVAQEQPAVVGITIHTPFYAERVRLAKFIRERHPEALLIAGGHHPSAEPAHLLMNSEFDVCVIGEGEETLLEIAQHIPNGAGVGLSPSSPGDWLRDIRGLVFTRGSEIIHNPPRPPVTDLDSLPLPAHHLLGLEKYTAHPNLGIPSQGIITYRGCPVSCAFCLNPQGERVRKRNPSKVADEMERVVKEFGVRGFNFYDNLFGLDREHTLAVCEEIIQRRLDVMWDCWTAGDLVDTALAKKMKLAGCVRTGFGAESGDDQVLDKAHRGSNTTQHQAGIQALQGAGIKVAAFFMIGLPGESRESVQRTVEFAQRSGADEICLSLHRPWPGTAIWRSPEAFGARVVQGPNFEAYIETEHLSRPAILECAQWAEDTLKHSGRMISDFLRYDVYPWENEREPRYSISPRSTHGLERML